MAGLISALLVLLLICGSLTGLILHAGEIPLLEQLGKPYIWSIIRFTVFQATLSTVLSVALAVPLSRALYRRQHFFGRELLIRFTSISLIVPTMVAILGIVAVHGRNGWINDLLSSVGLTRFDYLYGLNGILIAHVFFNLPLVTRLFLNGLSDIPSYQWRLATLYGFGAKQNFRLVEWPALRGLIPGAAGIVFLLCFTSFAIVLSLGGGPRATTLEVAIYQAIRFEFDLSKAVALSIIQIVLCLVLALLFFSRRPVLKLQPDQPPGVHPPGSERFPSRVHDWLAIVFASLFLLSPLAAVVAGTFDGTGWKILNTAGFWRSLRSSVLISICAGLLATGLGLALSHLIASLRLRRSKPWLGTVPELVGMLTLLVPPIAMGAGLFLFFRSFTDALSLGMWLVISINAVFTLAFTLRILVAPVQLQHKRFFALSECLGIRGWNRWRLITWPSLKTPICYALAVSTALSAGDMGVIALFGTDKLSTLPLLIYRLLGNYRLEQAAVVAVCLCALCFVLFTVIERLAGNPSTAKQNA